jgi:hypothetical protein
MKSYMSFRDCIVLTSALLWFPQCVIAQSTITIGSYYDKEEIPFGVSANGTAFYLGEYQQIYASNAFSSQVIITQIGFSQAIPGSRTANYNLSIGLGTTAKTPALPGTSFGTGFTAVFSGSLSPVFTATANDFDFLINFTTPFYYNPTQGNLLLDVSVFSATGDNVVFALDEGSKMGALQTSGSSVVTHPDWGLVTQFTVAPEPSSITFILLSGSLLVYVRRNKKHSRVQPLSACSSKAFSRGP